MFSDDVPETPRILVDCFGFLPNSRDIVRRYTITNKNKARVRLISLGAAIQSITVPNENDDMADVILGFDSVDGYLKNRYIGRIVGRVASSFCRKKSCNDEKESRALDMVNWDSCILEEQVVMVYLSRGNLDNGSEYSGDLMVQVKYEWTDDNRLHVDISATSTKSTPIDLSSQCLFNLAGHGMGAKELKTHVITVNADQWAKSDLKKELQSTTIEDVCGTVYDLRFPLQLSSEKLFKVSGGGYNNSLCITAPSAWTYRFHARILHPTSHRFLEIYSNQPSLQLYTANDFPDPKKFYPKDLNDNDKTNKVAKCYDKIVGKDGLPYTRFGCFAAIPRGYPKTKMCDKFPSNILHPGKVYVSRTTYEFGVMT
ncbi:hypothetical protein QAD02_022475 [Eretmocerus hayati]|uniref:Uncharacterized protein n=1 Tax=Eretmocerus hayati TaxID=131215 RepID=A0ACC2PV69_9HYME|nr:hypothetical protein QAD02_022475 [Eretmocerus hayati]